MAISMNFNEALDSTKIDNISFINWLSSQKVIPNINVPRYCASCENLIKIEYNDNHSGGAIYRCTSRNTHTHTELHEMKAAPSFHFRSVL